MATALNLINAIRTTASTEYQTRIPEATRTNIADVGNAITSFEADKEVFLNTLVGKIITTIVNDKMYTNKLARFNKGNLEFGSTIEEVYTEIISSQAYNKDAVDVFAKNKPTVKALYHKIDRQLQYVLTIEDKNLKRAFLSVDKFNNFIQSLINALYKGRTYDEYIMTKELIGTYHDYKFTLLTTKPTDWDSKYTKYFVKDTDGNYVVNDSSTWATETFYVRTDETVKVVPTITDESTAKGFLLEIKKLSSDLTYMTNQFNKAGVKTFTEKKKQILFVNKDVLNVLDVGVLAGIFNLDKANLETQVIEVDDFGNRTNTYAILMDEEMFFIYNTLDDMETIRNPKGRYTNYFLNLDAIYSLSTFHNFVVLEHI